MFPSMDANDALEHLLDVSDEIRVAVVVETGEAVASNLDDEDAAEQIAGLADAMLAYATTVRRGTAVRHLRAVTPDGDVYVARAGEQAVVAVASPGSLPGLVRHDLRTLLTSLSRRRKAAVAHA
jgi:predicted regulator of Ras-like GTPase activity (Roadblock/LC7/MglB family)